MIRYFTLEDINRIYELGDYFGESFRKTNNLAKICR